MNDHLKDEEGWMPISLKYQPEIVAKELKCTTTVCTGLDNPAFDEGEEGDFLVKTPNGILRIWSREAFFREYEIGTIWLTYAEAATGRPRK